VEFKMNLSRPQRLVLRALAAVSLVGCFLVASIPARAVPVDLFFDGATVPGFPETHYGVSETQAITLNGSFGVPIVDDFDFVGSLVGALSLSQTLESFSPSPPTAPVIRASAIWDAENVSGIDLLGATYLIFTSSTPFVKDGVMIDYTDTNVGLTIDADRGWALVQVTSAGGDDFFYPAIVLDRSVQNPLAGQLLNGDSQPVPVEYVLKEALIEAPANSNSFQLPLFNVGVAFAAVPEPTTAVLVCLGLGALAIRRRRS
jgi:hypothetical protein